MTLLAQAASANQGLGKFQAAIEQLEQRGKKAAHVKALFTDYAGSFSAGTNKTLEALVGLTRRAEAIEERDDRGTVEPAGEELGTARRRAVTIGELTFQIRHTLWRYSSRIEDQRKVDAVGQQGVDDLIFGHAADGLSLDEDDAFAIAQAARSPDLDLRAVTTVYGDVHLRGRLARKLLDLLGRQHVPVAAGLARHLTPDKVPYWGGWEGEN